MLVFIVVCIIVGIYILIASVTPVWILLQPRDYLSSFLLYGMMIIAVVGIVGAHPTLSIPAFKYYIARFKIKHGGGRNA